MSSFAVLLKRELWEHRALTLVPLALAGIIVLSAVLLSGTAITRMAEIDINIDMLAGADLAAWLGSFNGGLMMVFMFVTGWVVVFYLLDCLKAEREDRTIMFWKSLPVSDTTTVLSKLTSATIVAPLIAGAVGFVCLLALLIVASITLAITGAGSAAALWTNNPFLESAGRVLYAVPVQALWFFPITCWLLLVSSYANRAVFLWAILPPGVLVWAESMTFGTTTVATFIGEHFQGIFPIIAMTINDSSIDLASIDGYTGPTLAEVVNPTLYLQRPELWEGLVVGAALLAGAIWMRRYRDESL